MTLCDTSAGIGKKGSLTDICVDVWMEGQTGMKSEIVILMLKLNIVKIQLGVDILLIQGRPRLPTTSKGNRLVF